MSSNTFSELFGAEREVELAALKKLGKGGRSAEAKATLVQLRAEKVRIQNRLWSKKHYDKFEL